MPSYQVRHGHPRTRFAKGNARRGERRERAEQRQEEYNKLSLEEKILRTERAPGESKKELAHLRAQLT